MFYLGVDQQPANDTFCEGTIATLNCTIVDNSDDKVADSTVWYNVTSGSRISETMVHNSRDDDNVVTSILSIVNVSVSSINNTKYRCVPQDGTESCTAVVIVIGENSIHTYTRNKHT